MAHSLHELVHGLRLLTGTEAALKKCRWSWKGCITDQGTVKGVADSVNLTDLGRVADVFASMQASGEVQVPTTGADPDAFLLLVCVGYRGPLHQLWNAFRTAVEKSPGWERYLFALRGCLFVLGHKRLLARYLAKARFTGEEKKTMSRAWRHNVVDWKWGYMTKAFAKLSAVALVFLRTFDVGVIKASVVRTRTMATAIRTASTCRVSRPSARHKSSLRNSH